jgi:hypothetical protein
MLEKFNPANEGLYSSAKDGNVQQDWAILLFSIHRIRVAGT